MGSTSTLLLGRSSLVLYITTVVVFPYIVARSCFYQSINLFIYLLTEKQTKHDNEQVQSLRVN